jgi:hypothetical protein
MGKGSDDKCQLFKQASILRGAAQGVAVSRETVVHLQRVYGTTRRSNTRHPGDCTRRQEETSGKKEMATGRPDGVTKKKFTPIQYNRPSRT